MASKTRERSGADEMYVTYDLQHKGANGKKVVLGKVKRVYIAGEVQHWEAGHFEMRSGRTAHGVRVEYEQSRKGYIRSRAGEESHVPPGVSLFTKVVELPDRATNIAFHTTLPDRYHSALQDVR